MESTGAGVSKVLMREKKQTEEAEEKEEEYHMMKNEMIFYLREYPNCRLTGVAEWGENSQGDIMKEVDTYFLHILTGRRCETPWACLVGVVNFNGYYEEIWETLCMRIENYVNIEQDMCYEKEICV